MAAEPKIDPRGLKRICSNCGNRFYDLNKRPIICPSCETKFTGEIKVKARRSRAATPDEPAEGQVKKKTAKANDEDDVITDDDDTLSLNDLDEGDDKDDDDDDDDIDLDLDDDLGNLDDLEPDADDIDDIDDIDDVKSGKDKDGDDDK